MSLKSYNDIQAQAHRVIAMAKESQYFKGLSEFTIMSYVEHLAANARYQHGIGGFCTLKDDRRPLIRNTRIYSLSNYKYGR